MTIDMKWIKDFYDAEKRIKVFGMDEGEAYFASTYHFSISLSGFKFWKDRASYKKKISLVKKKKYM